MLPISVAVHLSGIHQVNHRLAVPLAYFFGGFGIWGQMDIQAALGKQSLDLDGGGKPLGCSVVQRLRWFSHGEFHIHLNGVALVGPDFCPVLAEGIPLLFITPHDFLQNVPVDGVFSADTRQQRIDIRPAMGIQLDPNNLRLVPKDQADILADPCKIGCCFSHGALRILKLPPPG